MSESSISPDTLRKLEISTELGFITPEDLKIVKLVVRDNPDIKVEIYPKDTQEDVEVATHVFALEGELGKGSAVDPIKWHRQARQRMNLGESLVRITGTIDKPL